MIRHPFYIVLCVSAVIYLGYANARGWSFWSGLGRPFSSTGRGGTSSSYYGGFNHK